MKRLILFSAIVVPIVILLGYGLTRNVHELPSVLVGKQAPSFHLETMDGKEVVLELFKGKPVVVNFWATWCGPCFAEHDVFKQAKHIYKEEVAFLGVVYQDKKEAVQLFLKENGRSFEPLFDPGSKTAINYGVGGVPETFFIDGNGFIREKFSGILTLPYLGNQIEAMKN